VDVSCELLLLLKKILPFDKNDKNYTNYPFLLFLFKSVKETVLNINNLYGKSKIVFPFSSSVFTGINVVVSLCMYVMEIFPHSQKIDETIIELVKNMCILLENSFEANFTSLKCCINLQEKVVIISNFIHKYFTSSNTLSGESLVKFLLFFYTVVKMDIFYNNNKNTCVYFNNDWILEIFKLVENSKDGSIQEKIRFLICVIWGITNKNEKFDEKYTGIFNMLNKYSKTCENDMKRKRFLAETMTLK
jgi:hypothetical protein